MANIYRIIQYNWKQGYSNSRILSSFAALEIAKQQCINNDDSQTLWLANKQETLEMTYKLDNHIVDITVLLKIFH